MKNITESSGNVFADMGLANSEQELVKAKLTLQIYRLIKERKLTQSAAADVLGIKQPHVSQLMNNRAGNFSVGRLIEFLAALGHDVNISVTRSKKDHGEMSVTLG
jgi:predicted XRE-type DNA-binding protein